MAEIIEFPRRTKAEIVVMQAVANVQAGTLGDSDSSRDELLDLLLDVLDGPEALEVYNRAMQTY